MSTCSSIALDLAQDRIERMLQRAVDRIALRRPQLVEVAVDALARLQLRSARAPSQIPRDVVAREDRLGDVVEHRPFGLYAGIAVLNRSASAINACRFARADGVGEFRRGRGAAEIVRPHRARPASTLSSAARMRSRPLALADVIEHHQRRQQQRRRVRKVLVGDVRSAAVHGLEDRESGPRFAPGHHAEAADQPGAEIRDDVAVEIRQQSTSNCSGCITRCMQAASTMRSS